MDGAIQIKEGPIVDIKSFIDARLRPYLPYSLPLLRRCQFHVSQKHTSSNGEVWCADASTDNSGKGITAYDTTRWIAAHIDLTNAGQTQVWVFASWEKEFSPIENAHNAAKASPDYPVFEALFEALRNRMRQDHIPKLAHTPPQQWQRLKDAGKRVSEPYSRSKVVFGTVAQTLWPHLEAMNGQTVTRTDMSYYKYIICSRRPSLLALAEPPTGFHFEPMRKDHLQNMLDRTDIPRSMETIQQLPNIALYNENDAPVAWCLLSKDASIGSLHTEPEYRRKGLAELTARRMMAEQVRLFDNDFIPEYDSEVMIWSHADVSDSNIPSQRVLEKLGGQKLWRCAWIEVDIGEN